MNRPRPIPSRRLAWSLALCVLSGVLATGPNDLFAQDQAPAQTELEKIDEPFQHGEDPVFAYFLPVKKKAYKEIAARWRTVDLSARQKTALEQVENAIAQEEAKDETDEQRLYQLQAEKARIEGFYSRTKVLLEVDGDPNEFVRIEARRLDDRSLPISKVQPREYLEKKWTKVEILVDDETTSGADKKKNRQAHSLMLYGVPEGGGGRGWWRIETRLVPSKDGQKLYQLTYIQRMNASRFDKKSLKESELLAKGLVFP